jgi:N-alpha-acetyl-L-2,4-diaminobutyrate deacetylase
MMVRDQNCYLFSPAAGIFEPHHLAAQDVEEGQSAGFLHFVEDVDRAPIELFYPRSGVVWMASGPGRVQRGDVVAALMNDYDDALAAG